MTTTLTDLDTPVMTYNEGSSYPYVVTTPEGETHKFEFEYTAQAFREGYRSSHFITDPPVSRSGDPVLDLKLAEYERVRADITMQILDDVCEHDSHTKHLTKVMTAKCPNCHTCHEGRFTRSLLEGRYRAVEFEVNTQGVEIDDSDGDYSDTDYVTGYTCGHCSYDVDDDVLDSILWLTDETLYTLTKKATYDNIKEERDKAILHAKSHRQFIETPHVEPGDVKAGMPCRWWSWMAHKPGEQFGFVASTVVNDDGDGKGDGRIKVVSDAGHLNILPVDQVNFGAFIEYVGDFTIMQRTVGDWVAFGTDARDAMSDPLEDAVSFPSREAAIFSIAKML